MVSWIYLLQYDVNLPTRNSEEPVFGIAKHNTIAQINISSPEINNLSLADFKTWLSQNNITIQYQLAIPQYINCTQEQIAVLEQLQKLQLYEDVTDITISTTNNVLPTIDLSYYSEQDSNNPTVVSGSKITISDATVNTPMITGKIVTENTKGLYKATIKVLQGQTEVTSATTKDDGTFAIELPYGTYTIKIEKPGYLSYTINSVNITTGETINIGAKKLIAGDTNGDGEVDLSDLSEINHAYGATVGQAKYEERLDLNEDGIIGQRDIDILNANYYETSKVETYNPNTVSNQLVLKTTSYGYTNPNWKDQLTSFNGEEITYDAIGNPLEYGLIEYEWENGRQLAGILGNGSTSYKYNDAGIRTQKTVNGTVTNYYLDGSKIIYEQTGSKITYYTYDEQGQVIGLNYNGTQYYYVKNAQGDVIGILDNNLNQVVSYTYDSWGNITGVTNTDGQEITSVTNIGSINPIRYRSYYYDKEMNLYYLQSRYYSPEWGRFLNPDALVDTKDLLGLNLYAYCDNNPVNKSDPTGDLSIFSILSSIGNWFVNTFGGQTRTTAQGSITPSIPSNPVVAVSAGAQKTTTVGANKPVVAFKDTGSKSVGIAGNTKKASFEISLAFVSISSAGTIRTKNNEWSFEGTNSLTNIKLTISQKPNGSDEAGIIIIDINKLSTAAGLLGANAFDKGAIPSPKETTTLTPLGQH